MKLLSTLLAIAGIALVLTACQPAEPTVFGVKQSVWKTLTSSEKKQVIQGYNERQKINAQNAPIDNAIGATAAAVQNKQNMDWQRDQANRMQQSMPQIHMPQTPPPEFNQ